MSQQANKEWCISPDGEHWLCDKFDTSEAAVKAGKERFKQKYMWIAEAADPVQPEECFSVSDWLEHVSCQDDYRDDCADDWDVSTYEQREELEEEVQRLMADWLDRHGLRPNFFLVQNAKLISI